MARSKVARAIVWIGYAATIAVVCLGVWSGRGWALRTMSGTNVGEKWKADARQLEEESREGPVERRASKATEPPLLTLLRDYFPAVLTTCLLIASFLYGFLAWALIGSMRPIAIDRGDSQRPPTAAAG